MVRKGSVEELVRLAMDGRPEKFVVREANV